MNHRFFPGLVAVLGIAACSLCSLAAGCSHSSDSGGAASTAGGAGSAVTSTPPPTFNVKSAEAEQAAKNQAVEELKRKVQQGQVK